MEPLILHADPDEEYFLSEQCHILELSNSIGDPGLSIARARVMPRVSTRWHRLHGIVERYVVLAGEGRVEVGEQTAASVGVGSVVIIPAGAWQRIHNTGSEELVFLALCTPRFQPEHYEEVMGR